MVEYNCPICNKTFKQKCHFINHTEKKKKLCKPILTKNSQKILKIPQNSSKFLKNKKKEYIQTNIN